MIALTDLSKFKREITDLIQKGSALSDALSYDDNKKGCKDFSNFPGKYEIWYTKCLPIIKQLAPDRYNDFITLYSNPKRKEINESNYCIEDAIKGTEEYMGSYGPWTASTSIYRQVSILQACVDNLESYVFNIRGILQADIFDSELDSATHLLKNGFLRPAGSICGVVIEKHLAEVCKNHNIVITKKEPHISDFNEKLKDSVYGTIEWRHIQRLADIRNYCDHNKDREPTTDEVEELIIGTDKIVKTIF